MQPLEENTFEQIPWFATTQTGSIDLYASAVSRNYSNNLNNSSNSKSDKSQAKTLREKVLIQIRTQKRLKNMKIVTNL